MNQFSKANDHVLPRPVETLADFANATARKTLAGRLSEAFKLSHSAATAIANAVVDPAAVRKTIGDPLDPGVEEISVPGGTLLGIRTTVWSRRVMPDPRNPRLLPSRRHPFPVEPGTGDENSRFRPIPEPRMADEDKPELAELIVDIDNREHLEWASQQAASFILANNNWKDSIASQGVMEAVWLTATTYLPADGSDPATALTTAEGSSRATCTHSLLDVRSADVPYDDNELKFRTHIRKLNEAYARGSADAKMVIALRCEQMPALILVGFRPHGKATTGFPTAIKSLVALRHVDPPTPWGEGPENESLADEVLDELFRQGLISTVQRAYYAGSCTRAEARAANLSDDPSVRAIQILRLFTDQDERISEAVRVAVTSQSTRKRLTPKLFNALATALIMRSVQDEPDNIDQIRRYMQQAFGKAVHRFNWDATSRNATALTKDAISEVREWISEGMAGDPGPASLELAIRATYPLVVSRRLAGDRGLAPDQPDRRTPGEVLEVMRRRVQGVYQLGQALTDYADDQPIRAVDEAGKIEAADDGLSEKQINDYYLRATFPPAGKSPVGRSDDTPIDRYNNRLNDLSAAAEALGKAFDDLASVLGEDGRPLVESRGVDAQSCSAWREMFRRIDEELILWSSNFRRTFGTGSAAHSVRQSVRDAEPVLEVDDDEESEDIDGDE